MDKKPDTYVYPAVCAYDDNGAISVVFPDLGVATDGDDEAQALFMARDLLGLVLFGLEEDGEPIPAPSPLSALSLAPGEYAMLVDVYMPAVRMAQVNRSVKRTVTLPAWLNALALEKGINFSQVLQAALKQQLDIHEGVGAHQ